MSNEAFEPVHGVTRNPYHPKGKEVFAINFDDLQFKVDGKGYPAANVSGAFPNVGALLVFSRGDDGQVITNDGRPVTEPVLGEVEIIGTPLTCSCNMSKFAVPRYWDRTLRA